MNPLRQYTRVTYSIIAHFVAIITFYFSLQHRECDKRKKRKCGTRAVPSEKELFSRSGGESGVSAMSPKGGSLREATKAAAATNAYEYLMAGRWEKTLAVAFESQCLRLRKTFFVVCEF